MEHEGFDRFVRSLAGGVTRRGMLKRFAASSMAGPGALLVGGTAAAQRRDDNDKGNGGDRCRANGEICDGGQTCCTGFVCAPAAVGASLRCQPIGSVGANTGPVNNTTVNNTNTSNQTVTNNSVCAGDCDVNQNAEAAVEVNQEANVQQGNVGGNNQIGEVVGGGFVRLPSYQIDVNCQYDAGAFQTTCVALGVGPDGAPPVRRITLPETEICAIVIDQESRPAKFEEVVTRRPVQAGGGDGGDGGQASAGNGGTANASADGGTVSIGDVSGGENNVSVNASGGTANADASGGDGNVAIAGGGDGGSGGIREEEIRELRQVEPSSLTIVLEGNVVPARRTTYWLDTDAGRLPANGPALSRADETTDGAGAVVIDAFGCSVAGPEDGFDWFGQCTEPASTIEFGLFAPDSGSGEPVATQRSSERGRARFADLQPGRYRLEPIEGTWCHAESDAVDEAGNVVVEAGQESAVWIFTCRGK